jgi:hypothetical protein
MKLETYATIALAIWCVVCGAILARNIIEALCR